MRRTADDTNVTTVDSCHVVSFCNEHAFLQTAAALAVFHALIYGKTLGASHSTGASEKLWSVVSLAWVV